MAVRAANGQSSIFVGTDRRWHGWVSMGPSTGKARARRHVSGQTRDTVVAKVRRLERQRDIAAAQAASAETVASWFPHWLDTIAAVRVRPRTLETYRCIVRRHITPTLGQLPLDALQPEHLERLYAALLERGLAASTVLRVHRVLARALKVAHQRQRVPRDITRLVDPPAQRRSTIAQPLTLDDARRVLAAASTQRNAARWSVALALGLRQSEALALQWDDIDLRAGTLSVRRTAHRVTGVGLVYEEPKTDRSRRTIALPAQLTAALRAHREAQRDEHATNGNMTGQSTADGDGPQGDALVFTRPDGQPIDKSADYKQWRRLLADAGVGHVRLHDARHTAATLLQVRGIAFDASFGGSCDR
ncbi:tyrosine-type recombinase/integrase, partial [uncultured Jatrophihabitans sp.]|uniref:tyrosine-type recombinase/integrase n=1 Tax=uncultured Jatrophihabitans sp. TaxID=1610747 RepID=UPI0035CB069F